MLDPHVTRFPPTPLRTIVLSAYRKTGPAALARRASDDCRLSSNREGRSDCVILLDHRVTGQISTRRLRVVKYRGSRHGTNEYPFLIDNGIVVMPITSIGLENVASTKRISSGISQLDAMLGGHGFYRGSTVLVSGTGSTGTTRFAASFADAACKRGELK